MVTARNDTKVYDGTTYVSIPTTVATAAVASGSAILGAGAAGVKHRIFEVIATADTAGDLTMSDSVGSKQYVAANGQVIFDFYPTGIKQGTAATQITMTNTGGGNVSAIIKYTLDA